jgi:hypothetical protein
MIARCNRRAAGRGLLAVVLLLCVLRGGVRDGPEVFVDLRLRRAAAPSAAAAPIPAALLRRAGSPVGTPAAAVTATTPAAEALPVLPLLVGEKKLSLMLPLGPAVGSSVHGDHGRLSLLLRSLAKFFVLADLDALVIVTPDVTGVRQLVASIAKLAASAKLDALLAKAVVIADAELAPEVEDREKRDLNHVSGYTKQQVMKLASAARIRTEWYLTLDADVICTRSTGFDDLIRDGRALVNMTPLGRHRDWHEDADRLLGTWLSHEHNDEQQTLGVTPSLLHTESVRQLGAKLEQQASTPHLTLILSPASRSPHHPHLILT